MRKLLAAAAMLSAAAAIISCASKLPPPERPAPALPAEQPEEAPPAEGETPLAFAVRLKAALASGTAQDALALFEGADETLAADPGVRKIRASLLLSDNRLPEAKEAAAALIAENPADTEALILAALTAKASGDKKQKSAYIKRILEIDPANADANVELGDEQMLAKNFAGALRYYNKAVAAAPDNLDALFGAGKASYYLGDMAGAEKAFRAMLNYDPRESSAWAYLGKLETERGAHKAAQGYIEKALETSPNDYNILLDYGECLHSQGKLAPAAAAWEKAAAVNPGYFLSYAYLAGVYDEMEDYARALENYRSVVRANPDYYYAYESLGVLAWRESRWAECRAAFAKAREYDPKTVSYPLMIAACFYKAGDKTGGKAYLEQVIRRMDRASLDYAVARLYFDNLGDAAVLQKIRSETNRNTRGKMLFYMGLYYDLAGHGELAQRIYEEVKAIHVPMFFEYRLNEWAAEGIPRKG